MTIIERWREQIRPTAATGPARIALADADDPRANDAARRLNEDGVVAAFVVDDVGAHVDDEMARAADGLATPIDLSDPLHVATMLVRLGRADGCVAGASRPTADVIRAGLRILGVAPGVDVVSSCFFFVLPDGMPIVYGDCGVVPDPSADELASIAVSSSHTFRQLTDTEPLVAMLSFSTKGSSEHPRVDKVRAATAHAKVMAPDLDIDGELQFDAAWVASIGASKAPDSAVAGRANTFVFPDLDSGNIAYKITERLGSAQAFGPLLQGLDGVLHDLSRGCSVDDIVNVATISALQARRARR